MIRVTLHEKEGEILSFECKGHAGFAEAGRDIVCAAVSVLTTTCVNALETVAGVRPQVEARSGLMLVSLPRGAGRDAQVILKTLRQGLRDLREEYPEYLQLTELSV